MSYTPEMSFSDWVFSAGSRANNLITAVEQGKVLYDKWYQLTYGKTNAQVAALPQFSGKTEADISTMAYALGVFNDLYNALHNTGSLQQADRKGYLTPVL